MKLVIKNESLPYELNKGEAIVTNDNGKIGLVLSCPKCGNVSATSWGHIFDEKTQSLTPSIICNSENKVIYDAIHNLLCMKCDYHGFLKNGEFTELS